MTHSESVAADVYNVRELRPRWRMRRAVRTLFRCFVWAWLGWCAMECCRAGADAIGVWACSAADSSWDGVTHSCVPPVIELHMAQPTAPHDPQHGPGGA